MGTFKVSGDISFTGAITTPGNDSVVIKPALNNYDQIGASDCKFWKIHATTFYGNLSGNADTATTASAVAWANVTGKPTSFTPSSHTHSYIEAKGNYTFTSSTLPNSFDLGVSAGFVDSNAGFGSYGSVLTVRTYNGGGGSLQLYAPYSSSYGGTRLKARFGNYASSSGNSWTDLKELAWLSDLTWSNISGKPSTFTPSSHTHSYQPIESTTFSISNTTYVSVRTPNRTAAMYYEFWDSVGWAGIRAGAIYDNNNRVYSESNKPSAATIGAVSALGLVSNTATIYDSSVASIGGGSGSPSGSAYGAFITLPYRKASGNTTPDFAGQIFIPNGDDATTPDGLYYRTAVSTSWRNWKSVIHSCSATYFGGTLPTSGMNTGDVFFKT